MFLHQLGGAPIPSKLPSLLYRLQESDRTPPASPANSRKAIVPPTPTVSCE